MEYPSTNIPPPASRRLLLLRRRQWLQIRSLHPGPRASSGSGIRPAQLGTIFLPLTPISPISNSPANQPLLPPPTGQVRTTSTIAPPLTQRAQQPNPLQTNTVISPTSPPSSGTPTLLSPPPPPPSTGPASTSARTSSPSSAHLWKRTAKRSPSSFSVHSRAVRHVRRFASGGACAERQLRSARRSSCRMC